MVEFCETEASAAPAPAVRVSARSDSAQRVAALPRVENVEMQPLASQVRRLIEAMDYLGEPFSLEVQAALAQAMKAGDVRAGVGEVQRILDDYCLFGVHINPEMRVRVSPGPAAPLLVASGWRHFLVKVANEAGTTAPLGVASPQARSVHNSRKTIRDSDKVIGGADGRHEHPAAPVADAWLDLQTFDSQPLNRTLSGLNVEYRIIQLYSRDAGRREATFMFDVGQGTQDLGFRNETSLLFNCLPAQQITLRVRDEHGQPTTGSFLVRDRQGRVYPSQAKRLTPDFAFHPQVYRANGETLELPTGNYVIEFRRGPESLAEVRQVTVGPDTRELAFAVQRWIDPAAFGWWSGDHHIHAAGCAHYSDPMHGVLAEHMARHIQGEDLKIGANLTWGPGFDFQKQFFTGRDDSASVYPYLLRYDVEVSGFGSHRSGHLVLLRLREQIYPGGTSSDHWPTLGLNTLRWAKAQGAVVGPAHSGWGLQPVAADAAAGRASELSTLTDEVPNLILPPFSGIGANEYIMNVTHEVPGPDGHLVPAVDFISLADTPYPWELNIWYHTLNAGFRTRASGETDFPCIYGERVGMGRSYVKLEDSLTYEDWCEGIRAGRAYVSDGKSHILDFRAGSRRMGEGGSELRLSEASVVRLSARVAGWLEPRADPRWRNLKVAEKPYWDLERARIGETRTVPVEVVVNGKAVAQKNIVADGTLHPLDFEVPLTRSSWVALRILGSSHTNPIFIVVGDKPIRASRRSVEWCLQGVDQCWAEKEKFYAAAELPQARADFEHARRVYRQRLAECEVD